MRSRELWLRSGEVAIEHPPEARLLDGEEEILFDCRALVVDELSDR